MKNFIYTLANLFSGTRFQPRLHFNNTPTLDETATVHEIYLAGEDAPVSEDEDLVVKTILRTGIWSITPGLTGPKRKPLKIVRDGRSDHEAGVVALSDIVQSFEDGAFQYVTVPLSDDAKDHKNIARVNTGFVKKLWVEDGTDGISRLKAGINFTEPEVKEKALRGTIADCSSGILFNVIRKSDGYVFPAALEHVALTNRPWIDGMEPFGIAASDDAPTEVASYVEEPTADPPQAQSPESVNPDDSETLHPSAETPVDTTDPEWRSLTLRGALKDYGLSGDYSVEEVNDGVAVISNVVAGMTWDAIFTIEGEKLTLSPPSTWKVKGEVTNLTPAESAVPAAPAQPSASLSQELYEAQRQRMALLSDQPHGKRSGGEAMPLSKATLDRLDLSEEDRSEVESVLEENARLKRETAEGRVEKRLGELKELGLSEAPGFLKFYREIMLSNDEQPAVVLLADDGTEKESLSAIEILDRAIDALPTEDGKLTLSDQALVSGHDNPPPLTAEGETEPVSERVAKAKAALGLADEK